MKDSFSTFPSGILVQRLNRDPHIALLVDRLGAGPHAVTARLIDAAAHDPTAVPRRQRCAEATRLRRGWFGDTDRGHADLKAEPDSALV